tara:strand:+ start:53 stop:442 length:390 start_codon:yes stop_codon:yes gene_type:complete
MKKIITTGLLASLFISSIYAQDMSNKIHSPGYIKDYSVNIKSIEHLKQGDNKITIKFTHKGHSHNDLKSKLTIYSPDNTSLSYKGQNTKTNGKYLYEVNLKEKGTYRYVLTFSHESGVTQIKRNSFIVE